MHLADIVSFHVPFQEIHSILAETLAEILTRAAIMPLNSEEEVPSAESARIAIVSWMDAGAAGDSFFGLSDRSNLN